MKFLKIAPASPILSHKLYLKPYFYKHLYFYFQYRHNSSRYPPHPSLPLTFSFTLSYILLLFLCNLFSIPPPPSFSAPLPPLLLSLSPAPSSTYHKHNKKTNITTLYHRAAASDASDAIKALANAGSEIDAQTSSGSTALHIAGTSGKILEF